MTFDAQDKKITVSEEIFLNLPSDVKLDALILQKLGRLEIVPTISGTVI